DSSRSDRFSFGEAIRAKVSESKGRIGKRMVWVKTQGLLSGLDRLFVSSYARILVAKVVERNPIMWVDVRPEPVSFDGFVIFMGRVHVVMGCDIEFLSFADVFAPLKSLAHVFIGQFDLREVGVDRTEPGIGNGKIRIQINRHLVERNAFGILAVRAFFISLCV